MPTNKSETLNVRLSSAYKEALKTAATREQRSISNLVEHLIAKHCAATGIPIEGPAKVGSQKKRTGS